MQFWGQESRRRCRCNVNDVRASDWLTVERQTLWRRSLSLGSQAEGLLRQPKPSVKTSHGRAATQRAQQDWARYRLSAPRGEKFHLRAVCIRASRRRRQRQRRPKPRAGARLQFVGLELMSWRALASVSHHLVVFWPV